MEHKELIEKENWRKAEGVKSRGQTNSALAPRDYSKKCKIPYEIAMIKGYHIWWCSTHHQPLTHCEQERIKICFEKHLKETIQKIKAIA